MWTKSKEGVAVRATGEEGVTVLVELDARFRKYSHPEEGRASTMTVPLLWITLQPPSSTVTVRPFLLRHFLASNP